jgi:LuxR family maltose regulon positive regulatory protein
MEPAIQHCQEALGNLPDWLFLRGRALMYLGISLHAHGQGKSAERLLLNRYEALPDKTGIEACCILIAQGINLLQENKLLQAANSFKVVIRQTSFEKIATLRIWALFFLAQIFYKLNDLDAARHYLAEIVDHRYFAIITFYCQALAGMALIDQSGWKTSQARESLDQLSQFDLEHRGYETDTTQSLRAHLYLRQGDTERAGLWADEFREPVSQEPLLWFEMPHLTQVRILLTRNSTGDLQRALRILDEMEKVARQTHNLPVLIQISALRSMVLNAMGNSMEALFTLEQAVQMAVQGDNIRVFVDLGKPMQEMLRHLAEQERSPEMTRRILAAFSPNEESRMILEVPSQPAHDPLLNNLMLAEPLTARELDVLALLREPLSTKEIAQKLHISYATAKRHTINIYGKLGANGRWNAVARAVELGIFPAEVYTTS